MFEANVSVDGVAKERMRWSAGCSLDSQGFSCPNGAPAGWRPAVDERASDDEPAEQDQRQQQRLGPGLANGADVRGQAAQVSLQSGPDGDKLRIVAIKA